MRVAAFTRAATFAGGAGPRLQLQAITATITMPTRAGLAFMTRF